MEKVVCNICKEEIDSSDIKHKLVKKNKVFCKSCREIYEKIYPLSIFEELEMYKSYNMFCSQCGSNRITKTEETIISATMPLNDNGQPEYRHQKERKRKGKEYYTCKDCGLESNYLRGMVKFKKGKDR